MIDVSIIPPAVQVTGVTGGGQTQSATEAVNLAQALSNLSVISGVIAGKDTNGNFLLKTSYGILSLQSNLPLTYNSDVVLRLTSGTAQGAGSAKIVSVNGEPFSDFIQPQQAETDSLSQSLANRTMETASSDLLSQPGSRLIPAVVVSSSPASASPSTQNAGTPSGGGNPLLPNGTPVLIRLPASAVVLPQEPALFSVPDSGSAYAPQSGSAAQATQQTPVQVASAAVTEMAPAVLTQAAVSLPQPAPAPASGQASSSSAQPQLQSLSPSQAQAQQNNAAPSSPVITQIAVNPLYATYAKQAATSTTQGRTEAQSPATTVGSASDNVSQAPASGQPQKAPVLNPGQGGGESQNIQVQGQVLSVRKDGVLSVQTPTGSVTLKTDAPAEIMKLAPGSVVALEVSEHGSQLVAAAPQEPPAPPASFAELAASWGSLKVILSVLSGGSADAVDAADGGYAATGNDSAAGTAPSSGVPPQVGHLLSRLPQLGDDFVSSSLAFLKNMQSGDMNAVLGNDTVNSLKQAGRGDLVQKFTQEMANLNDAFTMPAQQPLQGWQASVLPFVFQGELQQARIFVKRDAPGKKQQAEGASVDRTRFIVEVDLSEYGGVQMDGLVQRKQAGTVFDLVVRSGAAFSPQEKVEMTSLYNDAAEQTGFTGTIAFQTSSDFPVKPLDEVVPEHVSALTA